MTREQRLARLWALRAEIDTEIARLTHAPPPGRKRQTVALCGTDSGYYKHRRADPPTPACDPCKAAHREAENDRARRRRAA